MDKKNFLIGISLLILAFYLINVQSEQSRPKPEQHTKSEPNASSERPREEQVTPAVNPIDDSPGSTTGSDTNSSQSVAKKTPETLIKALSLGENDPIEIFFTNHGGAIREIRLKKTNRVLKEYNFQYEDTPALGLAFENHDKVLVNLSGYGERAFNTTYDGQSSRLTWEKEAGGIKIRREYWREKGEDPYLIHHITTLTAQTNIGHTLIKDLARVRLHMGSIRPINRLYNLFDDSQTYINVGYYNAGEEKDVGCRCANCSGRIDGAEDEFWQTNEFGDSAPPFNLTQSKWACVNNRFFVNLVRPIKEPRDAVIRASIIDIEESDENGISGSLSFPFETGSDGSRNVEIIYYAGPKDYTRLQALGHEQKAVMQFGIFWWVSEPLNAFLNLLHGWLGNFGWAIIVMTICVKLALWPLTAKSIRSQKKMQALQEPMQALREKYKGNPQKLNQEMMKFYKEQGVNPLAGCWPMLIQMPIFLGLFWMLRSAAELRGAEFLWIEDLSEQDNVAFLGSFSLNVLPLFMTLSQYFQKKLTPMNLGPNASEQQRIQAKMMRMMPYFFLLILYFFSSALVLYWTVQNLLSIVQTLITKRGDPPPPPTIEEKGHEEKTKSLDPALHISSEERDCRKVMGLRLRGNLTKKEIKAAFRERIAKYHPDKIRNLGLKRQLAAEEKRKSLEKAYDFLLNKD